MDRHKLLRAAGDRYDESVPFMGYNGIRPSVIKDSFRECLSAELDFLQFEEDLAASLVEYCSNHVIKFVDEIWSLWTTIKSSAGAATVAAQMKEDYKNLESFVIDCADYLNWSGDVDWCYQPTKCSGDTREVRDGLLVCQKCPYYLNKTFYLCPVLMEEGVVCSEDHFEVHYHAYTHLWLCVIRILKEIRNHCGIDFDEGKGEEFYTLLLLAPAIGKVYEMTNPVDEELSQALIDKKIQLETSPVPRSNEEWDYFWHVWDEVNSDIQKQKPYALTWSRALELARDELEREFDPKKDRTYSAKASSHKIRSWSKGHSNRRNRGKYRKRKQCAFLVSAIETDSLANEAAAQRLYDKFNIKLSYNEKEDPDLSGLWSEYTTVCNRSKRKQRGIRLAEGPLQDVCFFLEKKQRAVFDRLATSCRRNQSKGYVLGKRATRRWYEFVESNREVLTDEEFNLRCPCLYNTDFTDATDTLNQDVTHRFDHDFFGEEHANYWKLISTKPFGFRMANKDTDGNLVYSIEMCEPKQGQPQGIHSCFTDFDGKHQHIALMTVKILSELKQQFPEVFKHTVNYENIPVERMFAILGDDNGFWSIKGDPVIDEKIFPFFDSTIGCSRAMYQVYCWVCKMHNWYLNPAKAVITTPDSAHAKWEFAKVMMVDGKTMTPPPFRMVASFAMRKGVKHKMVKPLAFALWRAKVLQDNANEYIDCILKRYSDDEEMYNFMHQLMHGGYFRSLKNLRYNDDILTIDSDVRAFTNYAYICSALKMGLISQILGDRDIENADSYGLDDLLWNEYDENLFAKIEKPEDHKLAHLQNHNSSLNYLVQEIFSYDGIDERIISMFVNAVDLLDLDQDSAVIGDVCDCIKQSHDILKGIQEGLDTPVDFVDNMISIDESKLEDIDRFLSSLLTRGTARRPASQSSIGLDAWQIYHDLRLAIMSQQATAELL